MIDEEFLNAEALAYCQDHNLTPESIETEKVGENHFSTKIYLCEIELPLKPTALYFKIKKI